PQEAARRRQAVFWEWHMLEHIRHAYNAKVFRFIEGGDVEAISLNPQFFHWFNARRPEIKPYGSKTPLLRRKQERTVPKADIQPKTALNVPGHAFDHSGRDHTLLLEGRAGPLILMCMFENVCQYVG